jgi:hypothetical protein
MQMSYTSKSLIDGAIQLSSENVSDFPDNFPGQNKGSGDEMVASIGVQLESHILSVIP